MIAESLSKCEYQMKNNSQVPLLLVFVENLYAENAR